MADSDYDPEDEELFDFEAENIDEDPYDRDPKERKPNKVSGREMHRVRMNAFRSLAAYEDMFGDEALNEIVTQCERRLNWQLECVSDRSTIDDILLSRYDIYDPDAWLRYRNSWFEKRLRNDMHHIGTMHSSMFARALAKKKLNLAGRVLLYARELFWRLVVLLDRKLLSR
jgi:hypothetical protein